MEAVMLTRPDNINHNGHNQYEIYDMEHRSQDPCVHNSYVNVTLVTEVIPIAYV